MQWGIFLFLASALKKAYIACLVEAADCGTFIAIISNSEQIGIPLAFTEPW